MTTELIQEYTDSRGVQLAVADGEIRGVKILGLESRNGRSYPKETVARAIGLYEGAKVNVDHRYDPKKPRTYADRMGVIHNVRLGPSNDGLFADFRFNPRHALAEQLQWDAENSSESVGFSHSIEGKTTVRNGRTFVEEITRVHSVDLVADPATTRGLFESDQQDQGHGQEEPSMPVTLESLKAEHPEIVETIQREALEKQASSEEAKATAAKLKELTEEVDRYQVAEALTAKRADIAKELDAAKLPEEVVTEVFQQQLEAAGDEPARAQLIEDRKSLLGQQSTPKSRDQRQVTEGAKPLEFKDSQAFANALKR